jgi:hypothetical protein
MLSAICMLLLPTSPAAAADAHTNRIRVEYFPPKNPALQKVYEIVKVRRTLENLQELFSPFRLPIDLTLMSTFST